MSKNSIPASDRLQRAWASYQRGDFPAAIVDCEAAIKKDSRQANAWHLLGVLRAQTGDQARAIDAYVEALRHGGEHPDVLANLGTALSEVGRFEEAEKNLQRAIALAPAHFSAYNNLGNLYLRRQQYRKAIQAFDKTLTLAPKHLNALKSLADLMLMERGYPAAATLAHRATQVAPNDFAAWRLLAWAARGNRAWPGMLRAIESGLALRPDHEELRLLQIICLVQLKRYSDALDRFEALPESLRASPEISKSIADGLASIGRSAEALALLEQHGLERLIEIDAASQYLFLMNYSESRSPAEVAAAHRRWGELIEQRESPTPANGPGSDATSSTEDRPRKLRVGLVSGDLCNHSVSFFLEPLLRELDHQRFSVVAYHAGHTVDGTTTRLKSLVDGWRTVTQLSDAALADLIRRDRIDLLIDLSGQTDYNRLTAFALRPAPVQGSYLGYPNTSGLSAIDFRISDERADPSDAETIGCEAIARLPDCFHCYQGLDVAPPERQPANDSAITFGSFNLFPKINDRVIDAWSRILSAIPSSRLILKAHALDDRRAHESLAAKFAAAGIGADRLQLLGRLADQREHLQLYGQIDIALDTFPYNGTTTTCEALWMGVPVVSFVGDRHSGRVGSSLLSAIGHHELIGRDVDDYLRIAIELAGDRNRQRAYHQTLRDDLRASPLMNAERFARHFESLLQEQWKRFGVSRTSASAGAGLHHRADRRPDPQTLAIEIADDLIVSVPHAIDRLTPYVLLEQERWFEDEFEFVGGYLQPGMQVVDVGANFGLYALTAASRVGANGKVVAFEPTVSTRAYLEQSAAANGLSWLECRPEAVSDQAGELLIELHDNPELNRVVTDSSQCGNFDRIPVSTLDALLGGAPGFTPDFIKIDAEGYEAAVLRGARGLLAHCDPLVMFEIKHGNELHLELLDEVRVLGFDTYRLLPELNLLVPTPTDLKQLDGYVLNVFAAKPSLAERLRSEGRLVDDDRDTAAAIEGTAPATLATAARDFRAACEPSRTAKVRVALARQALRSARIASERSPTAASLSTLARIAAAIGERSIAVAALARALTPGLPSGIDSGEFLPPGRRFDAVAGTVPAGDWLQCAIVERFVQLQAFSGYFDQDGRHLPLLDRVAGSPYFSPEMARRRQLLRVRSGRQPGLQADPLLAQRSPAHRNPEWWTGSDAAASDSPADRQTQ